MSVQLSVTADPRDAAQRLAPEGGRRVVKPGQQHGRRAPARGGQGRRSPAGKPGNKPSGNASRQRSQQPLLSTKHRWSSRDLSNATHLDLSERVHKLQQMVEELQRALNKKSSTAKCAAATNSGARGKTTSMGGRTMSAPHIPSSPLFTRSADRRHSGPNGRPAQSATAAPSAAVPRPLSSKNQGGKPKHVPSIATGVTTLAKTGTIPSCPVKEPKPEHLVNHQAPEKPAMPLAKARELPRHKGVSFAETVKSGPVEQSNKPILKLGPVVEAVGDIVPRNTKRALRANNKKWVDEELVHFLRMEFAFKPRSAELLQLMHTQLRKHLRTFDTSGYTQKQLYDLSIETVGAAMPISEMEQGVRAGMKDGPTLEEMRKNNDFVVKGVVGNVGAIFKRKFEMPGKPK